MASGERGAGGSDPGRAADSRPDPAAEARNLLRRRQAVGILLIAAAILVFTLLRADWRGIFPPGWWRW